MPSTLFRGARESAKRRRKQKATFKRRKKREESKRSIRKYEEDPRHENFDKPLNFFGE